MREIASLVLAAAILLWTAAFFFGPGNRLFWQIGSYTHYLAGAAVFLYLLSYIHPSSRMAPPPRARRGDMRKGKTCGRPAVEGSDFCRYHTDEQRWMGGGRV